MSPRSLPSVKPARGLGQLQNWFFEQLQPGAPRGTGPVLGTPGLSARQRLGIYAEMYQARLVEALALDFPRLGAALGPQGFERIAGAYLECFPSRRPTIQDVGARLPIFLRRELVAGKLRRAPFAADLARLERTGSEVYLAAPAENAQLTAGQLTKVAPGDWPGLQFQVTATLRVVRSEFRFLKDAKPVRERTLYRVYRRGLDVFEAPMDAAEARALALVVRGRSFGEVCVALGDAATAARALATWVDEGLLLGLSSPVATST